MVSGLGSLVYSCCGEGGALQTNVTGVCGEHSQCSGHTGFALLMGVCFPHLHCSGSQLLYMEQVLCCVRFQFSGIPQKRGLGWTRLGLHFVPSRLNSSGSRDLDRRTLPGCGGPYPLHSSSLSFHVRQSGACALCLFSGAGL